MVRIVKYNDKNISIKNIIIIVFILVMLISNISIGYLVYTNWFSSARETTENIAEDINISIYNQIYSFLQIPEQIIENNNKIIENGILDLTDEKHRDKFFVGVLSAQSDEIYSFSYGTSNGEYYGARRNENGIIEIMKNNANTGGSSWYYSVNEDMTADKLVVKAGKFDPRTRAWYKEAILSRKITFSPVYKHFVMDDLTISVALPIYTKDGDIQGVIGSHMLLTDIGSFLNDTVGKYNGYAIIIEKDSKELIANSMGIENFSILQDGTLDRFTIDEFEKYDFKEAYEKYNESLDPHFFYKGKEKNLHINVKEIQMEGLEWVVISAFSDELLITPALQSIHMSVLLTVLALLLSFIIYNFIIRKLMMPINILLRASEALSVGDLTKRVEVIRKDEIGSISESFNNVADKMQLLVNNLEYSVNERTDELHKANETLEENKSQLQLILDSAAEAIYGVDKEGNCTFCNTSCVKMLGYKSKDELLGKNMHIQIHHSRIDGTTLPSEECRIIQAIKDGKGITVNDEVLWRADGTFFKVEYHSYPQIKNDEVIGAVITFMDISERIRREEEIKHISCHDSLTGIYNRRCFEENIYNIDIPEKLPLSVIFADINGLKMTNDIFGHTAGDELIKKSAEILLKSCRDNDMIARVGGDEFIILLPNTNMENAEKIIMRIKSGFSDARVSAIKCSISIGCDTKISSEQLLEVIMSNAENAMYKDKTLNRKSVNKDIMDTLIESLHSKSEREKQHSIFVSELCGELGSALHLSESQINKLKLTGYLHDIGKITLDKSIFFKDGLTEEEIEKTQQHSVAGYRILSLFDETLDIAEYVYSHHEKWDGSGYPRGLNGEQIPLISRIVSIVETYDRVLNRDDIPLSERSQKAIEVILDGANKQFDPQIVEVFVNKMRTKELENSDEFLKQLTNIEFS